MENNNLNGISSASKKVIFGLVGVFAVFIVVMLFFLFNNSVQEGLTTGTDIEVIGASALLDVSNNNERRSNILEQSFRVANMNNKLGEIGFNALPSNDPLLNDDGKVKSSSN